MRKEIVEWIKTIVLSLVIALIITTFVKPTIVKNYSMSPTLDENDFLLINRLLYKCSTPRIGDIIVFKSHLKTSTGGDKLLIKRVIACPNDKIVIEDGKVYVNGKLLEEDYLGEVYTDGKINMVVPEGKIFVMGDNRGNSLDSRDTAVGLIDIKDIMGKAFIRLFPFNKIGFVN